MKGFNQKRLQEIVLDKRSHGYLKEVHYKYFYLEKPRKPGNNGNNGNNGNHRIRKLFLSYRGLLRVLFASHSQTTDKFIDWASKTLFAAQMGTTEQKQEVVANVLGISTANVKSIFSKSTHQLPCIYLLSLGQVKDLRDDFNLDDSYDDDDFLHKWGMTNNLKRRMKEHEVSYSEFEGTNLELVLFGYIDPQYISEAETKLSHCFKALNLVVEHETYEELAVIPKEHMKYIKEQFELISNMYLGHVKDLITQLKNKEHENEILKKDIELLKKDVTIANLMKQKVKK